jgi:ubiquinone biosynthesis protein UbiJ
MTDKNVYPLRTALVPQSFWEAWDQMDDHQRAAVFFGEVKALEIKVEGLERRIEEMEEVVFDE